MSDGPAHEHIAHPPQLTEVSTVKLHEMEREAHKLRLEDKRKGDLMRLAALGGVVSSIPIIKELFGTGSVVAELSGITIAVMANLAYKATRGIFNSNKIERKMVES